MKGLRNFGQVQQQLDNDLIASGNAEGVVNQRMAAGAYTMSDKLVCVGGALAGAAIVGSYMTGEPLIDVATAFNGAAGAATGIFLAPYVAGYMPKQVKKFTGLLAAAAVPALVDMEINAEIAGLAVGAYAGKMAAEMIMAKAYAYEYSAPKSK